MLALSREGGVAGERVLPLLVTTHDWDALGDRFDALAARLEDQELAQLMLALRGLGQSKMTSAQESEARSLVAFVLARVARRWDHDQRVVPSVLLDHWYELRRWSAQPVHPPALARTWIEHCPGSALDELIEPENLERLDEWLALVQTLVAHDPEGLAAFGFMDRAHEVFAFLVTSLELLARPGGRAGAREHLRPHPRPRLDRRVGRRAGRAAARPRAEPGDRRWWVPEDIDAPPSAERVTELPGDFTRADVGRVLADL